MIYWFIKVFVYVIQSFISFLTIQIHIVRMKIPGIDIFLILLLFFEIIHLMNASDNLLIADKKIHFNLILRNSDYKSRCNRLQFCGSSLLWNSTSIIFYSLSGFHHSKEKFLSTKTVRKLLTVIVTTKKLLELSFQ